MDKELVRARIESVLKNIKTVTADLEGKTYDDFVKNEVLCRASSFSVEQICEQMCNKLRKTLEPAHPEIAWIDIYNMRILIAHVYDHINYKVLYETIKKDLPVLEDQLTKIKSEFAD